MKKNEVGYFPLVMGHFGTYDYPRQSLAKDENGKCIAENGKLIWKNNLTLMEGIEEIPIPTEGWELLLDLQTGTDCYCAESYNKGEIIRLYGSGWADDGYPFHDEKMTLESDPYETSSGCYAYLIRKTAKDFYKMAKQDVFPKFGAVYSKNQKDLVLPQE
jgi:hypothetical protein